MSDCEWRKTWALVSSTSAPIPGLKYSTCSAGNGTERGHHRVPLEVGMEDAPDGVVDGLRQLEIEPRVALDEEDPVVPEEPEQDAGELRVAPRRRPVDRIRSPFPLWSSNPESGIPSPFRSRPPALGVVGGSIVEVPDTVTVEVDVPFADLPKKSLTVKSGTVSPSESRKASALSPSSCP